MVSRCFNLTRNIMKLFTHFFLILIVLATMGCGNNDQNGYNCVSGNCRAVFENPQYLTLSDCQSVCGNSSGYNCISGNCVAVGDSAQYQNLTDCEYNCGGGGSTATPGYNCVNGNCVFVSDNATYSTLFNCQNACGGSTGGNVAITANWNTAYGTGWPICDPAYSVVIGLGYSTSDVLSDIFFAQSASTGTSPTTYTKYNLSPGVYYYKAKKTFLTSSCGTGQGIPPTVTKTGSFTISSGNTTSVNAGSLN